MYTVQHMSLSNLRVGLSLYCKIWCSMHSVACWSFCRNSTSIRAQVDNWLVCCRKPLTLQQVDLTLPHPRHNLQSLLHSLPCLLLLQEQQAQASQHSHARLALLQGSTHLQTTHACLLPLPNHLHQPTSPIQLSVKCKGLTSLQ